MGRTVEPWDEGSRAEVTAALGDPEHWTVAQGRATWRRPSDGTQWSRAVVVRQDGVPVAVAGAFHPRLHPGREWCAVEVAPGQRERGHGTAALGALRAALPEEARPLRAKVRHGAPLQAARSWGFDALQRTHLVRVVRMPQDRATPAAVDLTVRVPDTSDLPEEAHRAWHDHYVDGHHWDPPGDDAAAMLRRALTAEPGRVVVVEADHRPTGVALLAEGDGSARLVGGAVRRQDPRRTEIAVALLDTATGLFPTVDVEVDEWMDEMVAAVTARPHEVLDEAWVVAENPAGALATSSRPDV